MSVADSPQTAPIALTIAGSDSSGGAGIQADLKTFAALGAFGASALTAATAQNTAAVRDVRVFDAGFVAAQIDACFDDLEISAVKTGMLANAEIAQTVAERIGAQDGGSMTLIVDPVMVATSGARLLDDRAVSVLLEQLLPMASLVTPNLPEAAALTGLDADREPEALAERLLKTGVGAVLIKGGHGRGRECRDLLATPDGFTEMTFPRAEGQYHGTGCALSAAITARMAAGSALARAVSDAAGWLQQQIASARISVTGALRILPFVPPVPDEQRLRPAHGEH